MLTSRQTLASETVKILWVKTSKGQHRAKNHLNILNYSLGREPHSRGNLHSTGKQDVCFSLVREMMIVVYSEVRRAKPQDIFNICLEECDPKRTELTEK